MFGSVRGLDGWAVQTHTPTCTTRHGLFSAGGDGATHQPTIPLALNLIVSPISTHMDTF